MLIEIREKSVYGNVLLYPSNEGATLFSELLGKKTFNSSDLIRMRLLGHEVKLIKLWY
jgi:hypothetical protein